VPQRRPRADGIDATPKLGTDVTPRHPFRHGNESSVEADFEEQQTPIPHPPGNVELTPEKRVKRVFDRDDALVAGIIN
jgi:hypothetical protein